MMQQVVFGIGLILLAVLGVLEQPVKEEGNGVSGTPSSVQESTPCSSAKARQFDFWVGDWTLDSKMRVAPDKDEWQTGTASNSIRAELDGCVIVERFDGNPAVPLRGMSVSVYDARTDQWKQTWVDSQGSYLDFVGEFKDGKMTLWREVTVKGQKRMQRMVFNNITENGFDWEWELSLDEGKTWKTMWHIGYTRRKA